MAGFQAGPMRVAIYDAQLLRFFLPGGGVNKFTTKLGRESSVLAKATCPPLSGVSTGELRRSIRFRQRPQKLRIYLYLSADAPHAKWVHEGTLPAAPITPTHAPVMHLRNRTRTKIVAKRKWVRGQAPNPWLRDAAQTVLRANRVAG